MWIDAEPGSFPMLRYSLTFAEGKPDPEDHRVLAYLREQRLSPRRELVEERDGVARRVLQFGQCYLGGHVRAILVLRERGIVAEAVETAIQDDADLCLLVRGRSKEAREELIWAVAGDVIAAGAAATSEHAPAGFILDAEFLREAVQQRAQTSGA